MEKILSATHIIAVVSGGVLLGALIVGSSAWIGISLFLLISSIIVGIAVQYQYDKARSAIVAATEAWLQRSQENSDGAECDDDADEEEYDEDDSEEEYDDNDDGETISEELWEEDPASTVKNMFGERVDKRSFAVGQLLFCGFQPGRPFGEKAKAEYFRCKNAKASGKRLTVDQEITRILPMVFGNFGCKIELEKAYDEAELLGVRLMMKRKELEGIDPHGFWYDVGNVSILLGIISAYLDDFVEAAKCFLIGLKTKAINLNAPCCDFIKYVLSKIPSYADGYAVYRGCGFDSDNPMGAAYGNCLDTALALRYIPTMQGRNGEIVAAFYGQKGLYGFLERRGSTRGEGVPHPVDIYETYLIDEENNVKKVKLYFNNYLDYGASIKCADGFFFCKEDG